MGRKLFYVPGSFYRTSDRTGFPQRAEITRKEWNGLIVEEGVWEGRQPQDLVRGVKDQQNVPEARPLAPNTFPVGPIYTTTTDALGPGDFFVPLSATGGMTIGDEIGVMLDNGMFWNATILAILDATDVIIWPALPSPAASGNSFVDYRIAGTVTYPAGVWDESYWDAAAWG